MKQCFLTVLYCLLFAVITQAQKDGLRIGIGYQRTWLLDKQASPLKYQTREHTFLLGYGHTSNVGKWYAQVNGAFGRMFPTGFGNRMWYTEKYDTNGTRTLDSSRLVSSFYHGYFSAGYMKKVSQGMSFFGKEKMTNQNYVGGALTNQLFYTDNIVRTGWMNSTSVNAEWVREMQYSARHFLSVKFSVPLFARNTRLPYHNTVSSAEGDSEIKTIAKQGSRFAWLGNFQNIRVDAAYEYALNRNVGLGIHYIGQWLSYEYQKPLRLFQNNIGLVATIK